MSVPPAGPPEGPRNFRERSGESVWGYTFRKRTAASVHQDITHYALAGRERLRRAAALRVAPRGGPATLALILATPQGDPGEGREETTARKGWRHGTHH